MTVLPPWQLQYFIPSTGTAVSRYCATHNLPHHAVLLQDSGFAHATLHFVDCSPKDTSRPVLLYFHGGGYVTPLQSPAFAFRLAASAGADLAILEYALAPASPYPGQLANAVSALSFLNVTRPLSSIIVAGESAGGNLALALLAHLQRPREGITPVLGEDKLRGLLAVSPRTRNEATKASYESNAGKDWISKGLLKVIGAAWRPLPEVWAAADLGDEAFWKGMRAERVAFVVGGDEVYRDDVVHTGRKLSVEVIVCPSEPHIMCQLDAVVGYEKGKMLQTVLSWLATLRL